MRNNLVSLQLITALQARTSQRLATGRRINTAVDDPAAYFAAANNRSRASDLATLKDSMGEALQTVKAASAGIDAITNLVQQAKALASSARASSVAADRAAYATQFGDILDQIDQLSADASYKGTNLLADDTLSVQFNPDGSSTVDIVGFDATSGGDLAITAAANAWVANADVDAATADLDAALAVLRSNGATLASNSSIVNARQDFTTAMVNTLTEGADNLTMADQNEEGANMLALQTRQQLGIAALGLASQAQQGILRLF
jgi:flagellin-like hook-associated protein FlgL